MNRSRQIICGLGVLFVPLVVPLAAFAQTAQAEGTVALPYESLGTGGLLQVLLSLGFVLLAIVGSAWALRRLGRLPSPSGGVLKVVATRSLGPRERVVLLQVGEEQLLLGVAPGRVEKLHRLQQRVPEVPENEVQGSFPERLAALMNRGRTS